MINLKPIPPSISLYYIVSNAPHVPLASLAASISRQPRFLKESAASFYLLSIDATS